MSLTDRFWTKVAFIPGSPCWEWVGVRNRRGYGRLGPSPHWQYAHRISWSLHRGVVPEGVCVLHRCDNPSCVNPDHLFLGTRGDNSRDRDAKDRLQRHTWQKLTWEKAREIRCRLGQGETGRVLAAEFGICPSMVSKVKNQLVWKSTKEKDLRGDAGSSD